MNSYPKIKTASGPILWYMQLCGFLGWASFWNTIYLVPGHELDPKLRKHELTHLAQIQRDGKIKFAVKYLYWLCKYGYWNNPYEVEARRAASNIKN